MTNWREFIPSDTPGTSYYWRDDGAGGGEVLTVRDVTPIVENNKRLQNDTDGYNGERYMKRVGTVSVGRLYDWIAESRVDPRDPDFSKKTNDFILRKLDDSDFRHFRSSSGRIFCK